MREAELDAWMERLAEGDRSVFEPLYRALHPRALRLARRRLGTQAEDAAQAALLRVFARASEFERGRPVLPWFYAIAANEIRAIERRNRPADAECDVPSVAADPEEAICERELTVALEHAVAQLDREAAEAIHAVLGLGPKPAIEAATFRKRVSRAYARLRLMLGAYHVV